MTTKEDIETAVDTIPFTNKMSVIFFLLSPISLLLAFVLQETASIFLVLGSVFFLLGALCSQNKELGPKDGLLLIQSSLAMLGGVAASICLSTLTAFVTESYQLGIVVFVVVLIATILICTKLLHIPLRKKKVVAEKEEKVEENTTEES